MTTRAPNIVFVFADAWRAQAAGFVGDVNCFTPHIDALAGRSLNLTHAVSGCSVCCPYRASLMTGQYPQQHGVVINDVELNPQCESIARAFAHGGYDTAYVGKWHIHGSPQGRFERRHAVVPRTSQLGFHWWMGFECNHDYHKSTYFVNDDPTPRQWDGYDALAQTQAACDYIRQHAGRPKPFMLMLSWGPPHAPYHTAPPPYRQRFADMPMQLRPNVPPAMAAQATAALRGYYAHLAALDDCVKMLDDTIAALPAGDDTIFIVTSDHGEMLGCQGLMTKLFPWDESIRVPFLFRWPRLGERMGQTCSVPIDAPDIMPTLLSLAGLPIPQTVQGRDWSAQLRGESPSDDDDAAPLNMSAEFHEIRHNGMLAYRGLRTRRHTYVRNTAGPWLLYDNEADPYQMRNLIDAPAARALRDELDHYLGCRLQALGDPFETGPDCLKRHGLSHYREANDPLKQQWVDPWSYVSF